MAEIIEKPKPLSVTARETAKRFFRHENAVLVVILVVIIAALAVMTKGKSISAINIMNVLWQCSSRGVAAIGQLFVILTAGIDLSVGGMALFVMCLGASVMTGKFGLPVMAMGTAVTLIVAAGLGAINGSLVSRLGMPALIVTLAMWQIGKGAAFQITRGGVTIADLPPSLAFLGVGGPMGAPVVPIIIFISLAVAAYFVLNHTTFGRSVYAVGGNPVSAWLSGINTKNVLFSVYIISGFLAGLAGLIILARGMAASVLGAGALELDTIAAVIIGGVSLYGGRGTLIGAVIGVIILGVINNGMNLMGLSSAFQDIAKGVIIITAVAIDVIRRRG